jgi:hypothetical protein
MGAAERDESRGHVPDGQLARRPFVSPACETVDSKQMKTKKTSRKGEF